MSIPITKDVTTTEFVFECVLRACLSSVLLPCNTTPGGAPSLAIDIKCGKYNLNYPPVFLVSSSIVSIRKRDKNKEKDTQKLHETHKDPNNLDTIVFGPGCSRFLSSTKSRQRLIFNWLNKGFFGSVAPISFLNVKRAFFPTFRKAWCSVNGRKIEINRGKTWSAWAAQILPSAF